MPCLFVEPGLVPLKVCFTSQRTMDVHPHNFHELVVVVDGVGELLDSAGSYPLARGDAFLAKPGYEHGYSVPARMELLNILYDPERLGLSRRGLDKLPGYHALFELEPRYRGRDQFQHRLRLDGEDDLPQVVAQAREIAYVQERRTPGCQYFAVAGFRRLVGALCECYCSNRHCKPNPLLRVGSALSYIDSNAGRNLRLEEVAGAIGMSACAMNRLFRQTVGGSPGQYLLKAKIHRAAALLNDPSLDIAAVAARAGFSDGNHLTKQFGKVMGISPRQYRRQLAANGATAAPLSLKTA